MNIDSSTKEKINCGHGGNHINLVMEHEHLNYHDACKWLLREFGITASIHKIGNLLNAIRQKLMNTINNKSIPKEEGIVIRFVTVSDILERHATLIRKHVRLTSQITSSKQEMSNNPLPAGFIRAKRKTKCAYGIKFCLCNKKSG